jgi:hypothetical protein
MKQQTPRMNQPLLKKGGVHQQSKKAKRVKDKRELKKLLEGE